MVSVLKIAVHAVAGIAWAILAAVIVSEALTDNREIGPAVVQMILGLLLITVMVAVVWAFLMLPLWLIAGYLRGRDEPAPSPLPRG